MFLSQNHKMFWRHPILNKHTPTVACSDGSLFCHQCVNNSSLVIYAGSTLVLCLLALCTSLPANPRVLQLFIVIVYICPVLARSCVRRGPDGTDSLLRGGVRHRKAAGPGRNSSLRQPVHVSFTLLCYKHWYTLSVAKYFEPPWEPFLEMKA